MKILFTQYFRKETLNEFLAQFFCKFIEQIDVFRRAAKERATQACALSPVREQGEVRVCGMSGISVDADSTRNDAAN
ncbi:TPA: hypothetical protein ACXJGC_001525 [Burkholderia cenocepacia]|uniref:Uncharacterized protein n=1 Tax=Burkholderia latens TaxID=488446 RepID=A0A6H9THP0_9BURK|nr:MULTISPECIES: hypothetical protein [Burkholderia]KAB0644517.1 hypothetical protein F7R21_01570 [Burkholderia latens]MBJ9923926.1 hypothetical protein [Burkholderia cenocepacia]UJH78768.1 hypothetical protein L0U95_36920 [Burkholderia cenocepacia]